MNTLVQDIFGCSVRALIGLMAVLACTRGAIAQESAKDYLEPRLNRTQFALFTRQIGLHGDQRIIADSLFTDYSAELDELSRELDEKAMAAGLRTVQDALSGRVRLSADELKQKRVAVLQVYPQGWPAVDRALDRLLGGIEGILTPEQESHLEPALRELHRNLYLHPRQTAREYQEYAGDGVDVLLLVEAARAAGGELEAVASGRLQQILNAYELQLDALLLRHAAGHREDKLRRKIAGIEKNSASIRQLDEAAITRWKDLYQLNKSTVQQIGELAAAAAGADAQQRWFDRFDQASFAWLYPRKTPDRQIEWIRQQSLPADLKQQAEEIYSDYQSRRREFSRQAIDIMLRARLEFQTMLYAMMDHTTIDDGTARRLHNDLLKNSGEQATLDTNTASALESLLDPTQREALRKAMQMPDRKR